MARTAVAARVFVASLLVYVATAGGSLTSSDAVVAFDVTRNLCQHGSLAYSTDLLPIEPTRGVDGRHYSPFGIAQSIYNIPFYLAGRTAERVLGLRLGKADSVPKAAVALGGTVAAAAAVALTCLLAWEVSGSAGVGVLAALLFGFGTLFWPYAKFGFNAPLATCAMLAASLGAWRGVRNGRVAPLALSGLALGVTLLTRHELGIAIVPVALFLALERTRSHVTTRQAAAAAAGFGAGLLTWAVLNYVRFGNPLSTGHTGDPNPALGSSPVWGLYGLLLSPSSSLLLYCPLVLLAVPALVASWRKDRVEAVFFGAPFLTLLLFYAQLGNWVGGRSYGPRYLVPGLPFLVVPIAQWLWQLRPGPRRTAAWALCALSLAVQLPGVLVDYSKVSVEWARQYPAGAVPDRRVDWSAAPLLLNVEAAMAGVPRNARYLAGLETPPRPAGPVAAGSRDFAQQFAFSLDFWWLYLFYLGAWGRSAALCAGLGPLVLGIGLGWRTWRRAGTEDGKRKTENGERGTENGERETKNEK